MSLFSFHRFLLCLLLDVGCEKRAVRNIITKTMWFTCTPTQTEHSARLLPHFHFVGERKCDTPTSDSPAKKKARSICVASSDGKTVVCRCRNTTQVQLLYYEFLYYILRASHRLLCACAVSFFSVLGWCFVLLLLLPLLARLSMKEWF